MIKKKIIYFDFYYFYKYFINYFYYINYFFNLNLNMNCNENKQQSYSKKLILNFFFDSDKKILCKKSEKKTKFKNNASLKNKSEVNKKF